MSQKRPRLDSKVVQKSLKHPSFLWPMTPMVGFSRLTGNFGILGSGRPSQNRSVANSAGPDFGNSNEELATGRIWDHPATHEVIPTGSGSGYSQFGIQCHSQAMRGRDVNIAEGIFRFFGPDQFLKKKYSKWDHPAESPKPDPPHPRLPPSLGRSAIFGKIRQFSAKFCNFRRNSAIVDGCPAAAIDDCRILPKIAGFCRKLSDFAENCRILQKIADLPKEGGI